MDNRYTIIDKKGRLYCGDSGAEIEREKFRNKLVRSKQLASQGKFLDQNDLREYINSSASSRAKYSADDIVDELMDLSFWHMDRISNERNIIENKKLPPKPSTPIYDYVLSHLSEFIRDF